MSQNYELLYSGKANGVVPVLKYKSKTTGTTVVIAQVDGPLVNGYFCLATEAHDDDGLPHTLEHLIFMGSEKYPYKGVLDLLANRSLASGTNAWTDTDHTCYTMTNAGTEGFLNLLPIYLDHVLYPTITEAGYLTEVHHVNGDGEDAGVVYCEMQARENTGESLTHLSMQREMYPGHCGYKSETGGILKNLRETCSHKKVCDYHREYYCPDNLCLIITGQVEPEAVFKAMECVEQKVKSKGPRDPYTRPWQSAVPPLPESVDRVMQYPADDEDSGMVTVSWRGCLAREQEEMAALMVLFEYLTDTPVSPLQRHFVEVDDPFCSVVYYSIIENSESCVYVNFKNVKNDKLKQIKPELMSVFKKIANGDEKIDMNRMKNVVHRRVLSAESHMEDNPHDTLAFIAIGDFLYGNSNTEMQVRLDQIKTFQTFAEKSQDFWISLLKKYFIGTKSVTIVGEPSKKLMEEMGNTEKERVKKQQETLGVEGLKKKGEAVENATKENDVEPPETMLTCVDVPDVNSIHFHPIARSSNSGTAPAAGDNAAFPLADIPVPFQLDDIQTAFASMTVMMDTACVAERLRLYLPLCMEVLTESPVLRDGALVDSDSIMMELEADTLGNAASLGLNGSKFSCGDYSQLAVLSLKVEREKYARGVAWLRELLYQVKFTAERIKIVANKMINDVAQGKRSGRAVVGMVHRHMLFKKSSNINATCMLRQHKFLTGLVGRLEKPEEAKQVIADMTEMRDMLVRPSNLRVHLSTNTGMLEKPQEPWATNMLPTGSDTAGERPVIAADSSLLNDPSPAGYIIGVGSVESAFLMQTTPCVTSYKHADVAAILVYIQYLTQLEGPMWKQIRGLGLSYHYSMRLKPDQGILTFILFKSTHVANAYKQAKEIVDGYLSATTPFSPVEFETCKSSLIFEIIEKEKTPAEASEESLLSYFRDYPDMNKDIILRIPKVTLGDLERVGREYIAPLFDVQKSKVAVCCHPTKVKEVTEGFKQFGRDLTAIESMDESFLSEI